VPQTPKDQPTHVQAREASTGSIDGAPFVLARGEILAADHPIVIAYPDFFGPLEPARQRPDVEQTTAGPGEKRGRTRAATR
jgi:hypothetical protein